VTATAAAVKSSKGKKAKVKIAAPRSAKKATANVASARQLARRK
jgi:hypothetical protein